MFNLQRNTFFSWSNSAVSNLFWLVDPTRGFSWQELTVLFPLKDLEPWRSESMRYFTNKKGKKKCRKEKSQQNINIILCNWSISRFLCSFNHLVAPSCFVFGTLWSGTLIWLVVIAFRCNELQTVQINLPLQVQNPHKSDNMLTAAEAHVIFSVIDCTFWASFEDIQVHFSPCMELNRNQLLPGR